MSGDYKKSNMSSRRTHPTMHDQRGAKEHCETFSWRLRHRGRNEKTTILPRLIDMRSNYPRGPALRDIPIKEHDTWANMMLRYTEDEHARAHNARTHLQERECEMRGGLFLIKTGENPQKLKEQRKQLPRPEDRPNNAHPHRNCI